MKKSKLWFFRKLTQSIFFIFAVLIFLRFITSSSCLLFWGALHIFPVTAGINSYVYTKFIIVTILLIILTFSAGRLYCSYLCPVGFIQDLAAAIGTKLKIKKAAPAFYKYFRLLLFITCLASAAFGIFIWGWLDHSSNFGRILTDFIQPIFIKLLSPFSEYLNKTSNFQISELKSTSFEFLYASLFLLMLVVAAALRPRWYCNTLCPSGAIYGMIAQNSFINIKVNENCVNCGQCAKICPAYCINNGIIDKNLCVSCYECVGKCTFGALNISRGSSAAQNTPSQTICRNSDYNDIDNINTVQEPSQKSEINNETEKNVNHKVSESRRKFLTTSFTVIAGTLIPYSLKAIAQPETLEIKTIMPPGAGTPQEFFNNCSACHLCISVCPSKVLVPSGFENGIIGLSKPKLDYNKSYCEFECNMCSSICPNQAIKYHDIEQKKLIKIGIVELNTGTNTECVAYKNHQDCGACAEHCPTGAVYMEKLGDIFVPKIRKPYCIGCGICQHACPVHGEHKPIKVMPLKKQGKAKDPREINADKQLKNNTNDFPF